MARNLFYFFTEVFSGSNPWGFEEEKELGFFTLWLCNIAMDNGPFIDGLPINSMVDLSMAMLVITRW